MALVAIRAMIRDENGVALREIADPAGGMFDAAGDFDRLVGSPDASELFGGVDPYGDTL